MSSRHHRSLSCALAIALAAGAHAQLIDFSTVAPGTAANGLVIDDASFTTSSLPVFLGDPAIVTDNTAFNYVAGNYLIGTATAGNWLAVDFAQPVTGITFGFSGPTAFPEVLTAAVTLFDASSTQIGVFNFDTDTVTNDMNGGPAFVQEALADLTGVATPVARMEIVFTFSLPFSQSYKFDNLAYVVPTPATALLLPAALVTTRRRRAR